MNERLYILTDGSNTKIGITTDFNKRMASYDTHNPNIQLFKSYNCTIEEAKRIETIIKQVFKDNLSNKKSKEWFSVGPETVDRYVSTLLEKPITTAILPSMHGVKLTQKAFEIKEEILSLVGHETIEQRRKAYSKQEELAELFATSFGLGIPEHKLPDDYIVIKDNLNVDTLQISSCPSQKAIKAVRSNLVSLPFDDHISRFFHLVRLATGHFVAVCTAKVSMPYLPKISKSETVQNLSELAKELGWYCTSHNDWSWHYPGETGLVLYQPMTPVITKLRLWENSFRKWLIERQELLKLERFDSKDDLEKAIEDVAYDNTFPLDINSYQELCNKYLEPFFGIEEHDDFFLKPAYEFLINKWKDQQVTSI